MVPYHATKFQKNPLSAPQKDFTEKFNYGAISGYKVAKKS